MLASSFSLALYAQGPADALRYSKLSYEGTARTIAMGNAFTALGGDIGGVAVNPAASAVMRHSEFTISPGGIFAGCEYGCLGTITSDNAGSFVLNNAGISLAFDTYQSSGLQNFNFSFAVNRVADFNSVSAFSCRTGQSSMLGSMASDIDGVEEAALAWTDIYNPYFESNIPWGTLLAYDDYLISPYGGNDSYIGSTENGFPFSRSVGGALRQDYFSRSKGGIMQYTLNFGFNVSDIVFIGFNVNLNSVRYSIDETYSETAERPDDFDDGFRNFSSTYWQTTTGVGFNGKIGVICTPVAGLRFGATFTTPTAYNLFDVWGRNMTSNFITQIDRYGNPRATRYSRVSPQGECRYRLTAPLQWSLGAAYTFGNIALLSVDYENVDYASARLYNDSGNSSEFRDENRRISNGLKNSSILRAGVEVRPLEALSLRMGYNMHSSCGSIVDYDGSQMYSYPTLHYISGGVGFRFGSDLRCSLDAGYQQQLRTSDSFTMYSDYEADGEWFTAPAVDGWRTTGKLVMTFTFRF